MTSRLSYIDNLMVFCVTFIAALFSIAKSKLNSQNKFFKFISDNTFGIYVFHTPILIGISVLMKRP